MLPGTSIIARATTQPRVCRTRVRKTAARSPVAPLEPPESSSLHFLSAGQHISPEEQSLFDTQAAETAAGEKGKRQEGDDEETQTCQAVDTTNKKGRSL